MKLIEIKEIKGKIILKSGLHIGAGDLEMKIGGTDNPVIKHPHTLEPFIPGSSLKGKVRSLLEMQSGLIRFTGGNPVSCSCINKNNLKDDQLIEAEKIIKIFGASGSDEKDMDKFGPTRAAFADSLLNKDWKKDAITNRWPFFEVKAENSINRIKGTAQNPRFIERVPSGVTFDFCISLKIFNIDENIDLIGYLRKGLKLLEYDALGGSGSRGYGRIEFKFDDQDFQSKFDDEIPL